MTGDFSDLEAAQLGGCIFTGTPDNKYISTGCGVGVADTIIFSTSLSLGSIITLSVGTPLPAISDSAGTTINGSINGVYPVINAVNLGASQDGLSITSNGNIIIGLMVKNAPQDGFHVTSNGNYFGYLSGANNNDRHGLYLSGDSNVVESALFGVLSVADLACGVGNGQNGIAIPTLADHNTIKTSVIGCNGSNGIEISGGGSDHNTIGPGNSIGTNPIASVALSNTTGVLLDSGPQFNDVISNTIGRNLGEGVKLKGTNTNYNNVRANFIVYQGGAGLLLDSGASYNQIGSPLFGDPAQGNTISLNSGDGVYITGANTYANSVFNNQIGTDPGGTLDRGNGASGVVITGGAHGNAIGQQATEVNIISGNGDSGVALTGGAYDNAVQGNLIGTNRAGDAALPNYIGVHIAGGAHDNSIGSPLGTDYLNLIAGNGSSGVDINGSTTTSNTVAGNDIGVNSNLPPASAAALLPTGPRGLPYTISAGPQGLGLPNTGYGILLVAGAHHNLIGPNNYVAYNTRSGIGFAKGPHSNLIFNNAVFHNQEHGVLLDAAGGNVISRTEIFANGLDGIAERNGAGLNIWSELSMYDNGGLGVDRLAVSDLTNTLTGPTPIITSTQAIGGVSLLIRGRGTVVADAVSYVEVYIAAVDPSGHGEGYTYVGTAALAGDGTWSLTVGLNVGLSGCLTALQRDMATLKAPLGQSSEFSLNWGCVTFLPLIQKP